MFWHCGLQYILLSKLGHLNHVMQMQLKTAITDDLFQAIQNQFFLWEAVASFIIYFDLEKLQTFHYHKQL